MKRVAENFKTKKSKREEKFKLRAHFVTFSMTDESCISAIFRLRIPKLFLFFNYTWRVPSASFRPTLIQFLAMFLDFQSQ